MLDHTGFPVSDYARSKAFYLQALAPLGYALVMEVQQHENDAPAAGFGANGKPDLWIGGEGGLQRTDPHCDRRAESCSGRCLLPCSYRGRRQG
jgi:catechol 2,3-dioxygenase-like lactoylglutathione lyase family enzyme